MEDFNKKLIFIASDHRGFALKNDIVAWLKECPDIRIIDMGPDNDTRCDALLHAVKLSEEMRKYPSSYGILICGSGHAMTMTANRFSHIRAIHCQSAVYAFMGRQHNDANVLVMGADYIHFDTRVHDKEEKTAKQIVEKFMFTEFLGGRYAERVEQLTNLGGL